MPDLDIIRTSKSNVLTPMGGSRWFYAQISNYITGTDRRSVRGQTVFPSTHPYNMGYAVKYPFFALILAMCRARIITNQTIHTSSAD
jgi:hypothetical protein